MPTDVIFSIAVTEVANRVPVEGTLEERTRAAMRAARQRVEWLDSSEATEDDRFRWALGAMLHKTEGAERDLFERSTRYMAEAARALGALIDGVPVDLEEVVRRREAEYPDHADMLPLMEWWRASGS